MYLARLSSVDVSVPEFDNVVLLRSGDGVIVVREEVDSVPEIRRCGATKGKATGVSISTFVVRGLCVMLTCLSFADASLDIKS